MDGVKEIYVDGALDPDLKLCLLPEGHLWRWLQDSVSLSFLLDTLHVIESIEIHFWAISHADAIELLYEGTEGTKELFQRVSPQIENSGNVGRVLRFSCPLTPVQRFTIRLSGGHLDPFFYRYRIGIRRLKIGKHRVAKPENMVASTKAAYERLDHPLSEEKQLSKQTIRRNPKSKYTLPEARVVMDALSQSDRSPWKILSGKTSLGETSGIQKSMRYILPRLASASMASLPSRQDILSRCHTL